MDKNIREKLNELRVKIEEEFISVTISNVIVSDLPKYIEKENARIEQEQQMAKAVVSFLIGLVMGVMSV